LIEQPPWNLIISDSNHGSTNININTDLVSITGYRILVKYAKVDQTHNSMDLGCSTRVWVWFVLKYNQHVDSQIMFKFEMVQQINYKCFQTYPISDLASNLTTKTIIALVARSCSSFELIYTSNKTENVSNHIVSHI